MCILDGIKHRKSFFVVLTFYGLISTSYTLELSSSLYKNGNGRDSTSKLSEFITNNFLTTTHKNVVSHTKATSSYDQDSDDYHQAVERVEQTKQKHQSKKNVEVVTSIFNALRRTSRESSKHKVSRKNDGDGKSKGRYIKGDPLNGYFDAVMNEFTYKFWAGLEVLIFALILYSAGAAIFYSVVNTPEDETYVRIKRFVANDSKSLPWPLNSNWLQTASYGFQFILDAIEQLPHETNKK